MHAPQCSILIPLGILLLLFTTSGLLGRAAEGERPRIDREEHATVKTATFALG